MKRLHLLLLLPLFLATACRRENKPACSIQLTGLVNYGDTTAIKYNADGTIMAFRGTNYAYFNNGDLAEQVNRFSTTTFDNQQHLLSMKFPSYYSNTPEQIRYYYYDSSGTIVKTKTNNAGNPTDYLTDLTWHDGDLSTLVLTGAGGYTSQFRFHYYDTPCIDQYFNMLACIQVGTVRNRHLPESAAYTTDSLHYSYKLDAGNRVLAIYTNREGPTWQGTRIVDTTYCVYKCQ